MRILVTGGAGFIGGHTVDALLTKGHEVVILDSLAQPVHRDPKNSYLPTGAEFLLGDVRCKSDWVRALDRVEVVYHFAAYQDYFPDHSTFFDVNARGTALLFEVIEDYRLPVRKVVLASSQSVYGEGAYRDSHGSIVHPQPRPIEQLAKGLWEVICPDRTLEAILINEEVVNPHTSYGISKYTQELITLHLGQRLGIPVVALRYSIVQGPRQSFYNPYSGVCRLFCIANKIGVPCQLFEDGRQTRDFVNIEDVVHANLLVLHHSGADNRTLNVGGGKSYSISEFAKLSAEVFEVSDQSVCEGTYRVGDVRHLVSDISRMKELGWAPERDARHSLQSYKNWLEGQEIPVDLLVQAQDKMIASNVIQKAKKGMS